MHRSDPKFWRTPRAVERRKPRRRSRGASRNGTFRSVSDAEAVHIGFIRRVSSFLGTCHRPEPAVMTISSHHIGIYRNDWPPKARP